MVTFLRRYFLIFLVLWGGLAIWQSAGKIYHLYHERVNMLMQIEKTRIEIELNRGKISAAQIDMLKSIGELFLHPIETSKQFRKRYAQLHDEEIRLENRYNQLQQDYIKGSADPTDAFLRNFFFASLWILLAAFGAVWCKALLITLGLLLASLGGKLLLFYGLAPWVERLGSLSLPGTGNQSEGRDDEEPSGELGHKMLHLTLRPHESISVRDESFCAGYSESPQLSKNTHWIFSPHHPIMSLFCGLTLMTRFRSSPQSTMEHTLSISSDDPDEYFSELTIREGESVLISPTDLVAFSSGIHISACWKLFSLPAWCLGQIRYYSLSGAGSVVVRSQGGITRLNVSPSLSFIRKKHSLISASNGVLLSAHRTETLVPYLLGRTDLFDLQLRGSGCVRLRNAQVAPTTLVEKTFYTFLEGLGKLLGF